MREFTGEVFHVTGRGTVYSISKDQFPEDLWTPSQLIGETVKINDVVGEVRTVEHFGSDFSPRLPFRNHFGIILKENNNG